MRRDPPAEFWRYRSENCVFELFFYERDGTHHVDHFETRHGAGSATAPDRADALCLQRLIAAAAGKG